MKEQNFEMFKGETKKLIVTVTESNGSIVDLTGSQIKWICKRNVPSTVNEIQKNNQDGIELTNPKKGIFTVFLETNDTINMTGNFYHSAEITDENGNNSLILNGIIKIKGR